MPDAQHNRIATLDFEASGSNGSPIEVGVALYDAERPPHISVWSSLIRPTDEWKFTMTWDPVAGQIHNIRRSELHNAPAAWDVALKLNALLEPFKVAYCDGWRWDHVWLFLLMQECPQKPKFRLDDVGALARTLQFPPSELFEPENGPIAHRAGADAERLLRRALKLAGKDSASP